MNFFQWIVQFLFPLMDLKLYFLIFCNEPPVSSREIEILEVWIEISFSPKKRMPHACDCLERNALQWKKITCVSLDRQAADTHSRDSTARLPANKLRGGLFASSRNAQRQPRGCCGREWRRKSRMCREKECILCSRNARMDGFNSFRCRLHGLHSSCAPIQTRSQRKGTIYVSGCSHAESVFQDRLEIFQRFTKKQKS